MKKLDIIKAFVRVINTLDTIEEGQVNNTPQTPEEKITLKRDSIKFYINNSQFDYVFFDCRDCYEQIDCLLIILAAILDDFNNNDEISEKYFEHYLCTFGFRDPFKKSSSQNHISSTQTIKVETKDQKEGENRNDSQHTETKNDLPTDIVSELNKLSSGRWQQLQDCYLIFKALADKNFSKAEQRLIFSSESRVLKWPQTLKVFYYLITIKKEKVEEANKLILEQFVTTLIPVKIKCLAFAINLQNPDENFIRAIEEASTEQCYVLDYLINMGLDPANALKLYKQILTVSGQLGYIGYIARLAQQLKQLDKISSGHTQNNLLQVITLIKGGSATPINSVTVTESKRSMTSTTTAVTAESKDAKDVKEDQKEIKPPLVEYPKTTFQDEKGSDSSALRVLIELLAREHIEAKNRSEQKPSFLSTAQGRSAIYNYSAHALTNHEVKGSTHSSGYKGEIKKEEIPQKYITVTELNKIIDENEPKTWWSKYISGSAKQYRNFDLKLLIDFIRKVEKEGRKQLTLQDILTLYNEILFWKTTKDNSGVCIRSIFALIDTKFGFLKTMIINTIEDMHRFLCIQLAALKWDQQFELFHIYKLRYETFYNSQPLVLSSCLDLLLNPKIHENFSQFFDRNKEQIFYLLKNVSDLGGLKANTILQYLQYLHPLNQEAIDALCAYPFQLNLFAAFLEKYSKYQDKNKIACLLSQFFIRLHKQNAVLLDNFPYDFVYLLGDLQRIQIANFLQNHPTFIPHLIRGDAYLQEAEKNLDLWLAPSTVYLVDRVMDSTMSRMTKMAETKTEATKQFSSFLQIAVGVNILKTATSAYDLSSYLQEQGQVPSVDFREKKNEALLCTDKIARFAHTIALCLVELREAADKEIKGASIVDYDNFLEGQQAIQIINFNWLASQAHHSEPLAELLNIFNCKGILTPAIPEFIKANPSAIHFYLSVARARKNNFSTIEGFVNLAEKEKKQIQQHLGCYVAQPQVSTVLEYLFFDPPPANNPTNQTSANNAAPIDPDDLEQSGTGPSWDSVLSSSSKNTKKPG